MTENPTALPVESAAITDRGLSQKRPLNEDSMLNDPERHIFAVADGVGGAQAGEVASQTAIEVLSEAFSHHKSDEDIEDLGAELAPGSSAAILLFEHVWATRFRDAVLDSGGELVASIRVPKEVVDEVVGVS